MTLIDGVRNFFDNLFVPHDGLYDQAKELVDRNDPDGNGRVDVSAIQSGQVTPPAGLFGITSRGFAAADALGNGDGQATVKEVRKLLMKYDVGNGWDPSSAGNKSIDGVELLRMLGDLAGPGQKAAAEQAGGGAAELSEAPPLDGDAVAQQQDATAAQRQTSVDDATASVWQAMQGAGSVSVTKEETRAYIARFDVDGNDLLDAEEVRALQAEASKDAKQTG